MKIAIEPPGAVDFDLAVPGSKSFTNRALIAAALAPGGTRLTNASPSDDSRILAAALNRVGVQVDLLKAERVITVCGGEMGPASEPLLMGNAGTALRFLTSFVCLGRGRYLIDG